MIVNTDTGQLLPRKEFYHTHTHKHDHFYHTDFKSRLPSVVRSNRQSIFFLIVIVLLYASIISSGFTTADDKNQITFSGLLNYIQEFNFEDVGVTVTNALGKVDSYLGGVLENYPHIADDSAFSFLNVVLDFFKPIIQFNITLMRLASFLMECMFSLYKFIYFIFSFLFL